MEDVKNWIEISESRLTANYKTLAGLSGGEVDVLAVIKADAYGHSAALCAPVLARAGARWLGVTDAREGVRVQAELANTGIARRRPSILVMSGSLADEAATIVEHALTPVVWTIETLEALAMAARQHGTTFFVHVEVDTGMSRQGCAIGTELDAVLKWFAAQSTLILEGVMTHFASAEIAGSYQTAAQQSAFEQAIAQVQAAGLKPRWVHAANSSVIDNLHIGDDARTSLDWLKQLAASIGARAMARTGLALYGFCLPVEREYGYSGAAESSVRHKLLPVMAWKARVIGLRSVEPGTKIGYGGTFVAERPMRLAVLPVGYADGLRRELSMARQPGVPAPTGGWVAIGGRQAPIVGRISMNLTMVDVTEFHTVAVGDEAVILGEDPTAEDHAQLAGTIPYEILCGMKARALLVP